VEFKVKGRGSVGRPRLWWEDPVRRVIRKLGLKNWCMMATDKDNWPRTLKEAEIRP
jgi:hypothetical protein